MSLAGKNRKVYSYNNIDRRNSNFTYKDFEKSCSYHSNFSGCNFTAASLRAAKFKFCSFYGAVFNQTEFIGTNLRGCNFSKATFVDAIFNAAVLDRANFSGATFQNTIFLNTGISTAKNFPENTDGIIWLSHMPAYSEFSRNLLDAVESLRENDIVRRSNVLYLKRGKINTLSLYILRQSFSEEELIKAFSALPEHITTQFHTVSYLQGNSIYFFAKRLTPMLY